MTRLFTHHQSGLTQVLARALFLICVLAFLSNSLISTYELFDDAVLAELVENGEGEQEEKEQENEEEEVESDDDAHLALPYLLASDTHKHGFAKGIAHPKNPDLGIFTPPPEQA